MLIIHFRRFTQILTAGIFASTIGLGYAFSCSGRNLTIKKDIFIKAGGYRKLTKHRSGDDKQAMLLIRKVGGKIAYNFARNVVTSPETENFLAQQRRRYGKFFMSTLPQKIMTLTVFQFFLLQPLLLLSVPGRNALLVFYSGALFVWLVILARHKEPPSIFDVLYIPIYPYYLIFFSIWGSLGNWKWK